ncbi:MAG: AsmA-like C-terminal region-containing protein [Hyphomonas sp.]|uniref:YhdP family protein n=1 Tax=Hyphomonas sp. TaxID=87 RepID=UPI0034A07421
MVRQTASVIVMEIFGAFSLVLMAASGLLLVRLSSGPLDLGPFRDDVEHALADARGGRVVAIGALQLEWSPESKRVQITAQNVRMMDAQGRPAAEAARAEIVLSASALVLGRVEVLRLGLREGWIGLDHKGANAWTLGGDPLPEIKARALPTTPQGWLDYANTVLPEWLAALAQTDGSLTFEAVRFDGFELRARSADLERIGTVQHTTGNLTRTPDGLSLTLSGSGLGEGFPGGIAIRMQTSEIGTRMLAELGVADWPLGELFRRTGLGEASSEGLQSNFEVSVGFTQAAGIEDVRLNARSGPGKLMLGGAVHPVDDLRISGAYGRSDDKLALTIESSGTGVFKGRADLQLERALTGEGFRPFRLSSPALTANLTPFLEAPLDLASVSAAGEVDLDALAVRAATAKFVIGGAGFELAGDLARTPERQEGEPPVIGVLDASVPGSLPLETVIALWPVKLAGGARQFGKVQVETGTARDVKGRVTLQRDSFAEGYLRDTDLEVTFGVDGARVKFLSDLPPVENAAGNGRLTGNSFKVVVDKGDYAGWAVTEGLVDFPAFNPRGQEFRVFAKGRGPARNIVKTLGESRLEFNLDPARVSGDAEMTYEMFRPALSDVAYEGMRFTGFGTIRNTGLRGAAFGFDFTGGAVKVDLDQKGIVMSGQGQLGPSPVDFVWKDTFAEDGKPADLTAKGLVTADFLNGFGLLGRAYMTGEAPLDVRATLEGADLEAATVGIDFTHARLDMAEIGWLKPRGGASAATINYSKAGDKTTSKVRFTADGAVLDGDFTLGALDMRLHSADLRRAYFRNVADVNGRISRGPSNQLILKLGGKHLDISGLMPGLGGLGGEAADEGSAMTIDAAVERLTIRPGLDLRNAKLAMASGKGGLETLSASGIAGEGAPLDASIDARGAGPAQIKVSSGDAGFLASAFLESNFISGGSIEMSGTLEKGNTPADLMISISGARMSNAPFLTQILSLASLRGLADTLAGEGVMFSRIDLPLKISAGRYIINGAKAQGPALGLTASGFIDSRSTDIEIDGVLVPSFGVNSALGGIPILGDLVVGRDGEGVFSLTYGVRGKLDKASVSVNPLSALAPGVIRRIFENPSDTKIPEATLRPPDAPLPKELPPIKDETF